MNGWEANDAIGELQRVVLERVQVAAQTSVTPQVLRDAQLDVVGDHLAQSLVVRLRSFVLAEHLASHTETDLVWVPATWWDHFKHTHVDLVGWWSRWVWRLQPNTMHPRRLQVTWTDRAVYPQATIALPDRRLGPVVFWRTSTRHLEEA